MSSEGLMLLIDKPMHMTSFGVIRIVRKLIKEKKVGHAGTLDPLATGLLIICTGKQTKNIQSYQDADKEYTGIITIGATTPSYDLETIPESFRPYDHVTEEMIEESVKKLTGLISQKPPVYSAIKIQGKRAYDLARSGESAEMKVREVTVHSFVITAIRLPDIHFRISCSKGTYIRSIANDLGDLLGTGGYLSFLRRTRIGNFKVEDAVTPEELEQKSVI